MNAEWSSTNKTDFHLFKPIDSPSAGLVPSAKASHPLGIVDTVLMEGMLCVPFGMLSHNDASKKVLHLPVVWRPFANIFHLSANYTLQHLAVRTIKCLSNRLGIVVPLGKINAFAQPSLTTWPEPGLLDAVNVLHICGMPRNQFLSCN